MAELYSFGVDWGPLVIESLGVMYLAAFVDCFDPGAVWKAGES